MAKLSEQEQENLKQEIDKIASNKKFNKNWRITMHGKQNPETKEFEFVSFFPEIVKMVAEEFGVKNSAEVLKHIKVKPFGRSQIKHRTQKVITKKQTENGIEEKKLYMANARGLEYKATSINKNSTNQSIKLNQFVFGGHTLRDFDLDEFHLDLENFNCAHNDAMQAWRQEEITQGNKKAEKAIFLSNDEKQNVEYLLKHNKEVEQAEQLAEEEFFAQLVKEKKEKMKNDPKGFADWLENKAAQDDFVLKSLDEFRQRHKKQEQAKKQKKTKKLKESIVTSPKIKDELVAEGFRAVFNDEEQEKFEQALKELKKRNLNPGAKMAKKAKLQENFAKKVLFSPFVSDVGINSVQAAMRKTTTHEWLHAVVKQEKNAGAKVWGGVDLDQQNLLHEGMTEWLTQQVLKNHPTFYLTNEQIKNNEKPNMIAYEPYVAYVDIMETLFPGSVEDVFFNGTQAKTNHTCQSVQVKTGFALDNGETKIKEQPFSFEMLQQKFQPLEELDNLTNQQGELDYKKIKENLLQISTDFAFIKKQAQKMRDLGIVDDDALIRVSQDTDTCWEKIGAKQLWKVVEEQESKNQNLPQSKEEALKQAGFEQEEKPENYKEENLKFVPEKLNKFDREERTIITKPDDELGFY